MKKPAAGLLFFLALALLPSRSVRPGEDPGGVVDDTGAVHDFSRPPRRIVSLNPDFTANLLALGAGERIAAGTDFCPLPEGIRLGSLSHPNLEKIVALAPDLVLATREGNRPQTVAALRRTGIAVFVTGPAVTFEDYFSLLRRLGSILGEPVAAEEVIGRIEDKLAEAENYARGRERPRVFLQLGAAPIVSANRRTIVHQAITAAGGINVTADRPNRYPVLSREAVMAFDPDVIVVAVMGEEAAWGMERWRRLPGLRAGRESRVYAIDPDLICRLTPDLGEGVLSLAKLIHEEIPAGRDEGR